MDPVTEALIPLRLVPKHLPPSKDGKRISFGTLYRWIKKGRAGRKLPAVWIGGRLYVHRDALRAFLVASDQAAPTRAVRVGTILPTEARRILDEAGFGGEA